MATELSRSQFAHDTLKESTAALNQLSESYTSLDSVLANTRSLLGTLLKSQKSDTWYLETAFYVLAVTVGWLIFRRFLYGPAWWFVYLPLKMFWNASMAVFTVIGLRGGSATTSIAQSQSGRVGTTIIPGRTSAQATMSGTDAPRVERPERGNLRPPRVEGDRPLVDVVGEMTDETREQAQNQQDSQRSGEQQPEEQVQRNPKKRMWDEAVEAKKYEEQKKKDEL
jgi:protein transport protein SEC20